MTPLAQTVILKTEDAKTLVSAWKQLPYYKAIADSCQTQSEEYLSIIQDDSIAQNSLIDVINSDSQTIGSKNKLIKAQSSEKDVLTGQLMKANRRKTFWQWISGGLALGWGGTAIYKTLK